MFSFFPWLGRSSKKEILPFTFTKPKNPAAREVLLVRGAGGVSGVYTSLCVAVDYARWVRYGGRNGCKVAKLKEIQLGNHIEGRLKEVMRC